jgi:hypothetical protein
MSPLNDVNQRLTDLFANQPCWMIDPLAKQLDYSIPSVHRFLAQIGYYSSFTHNGRWYTLASTPRFSRQGLWFHQDIGFSRAGSLTRHPHCVGDQKHGRDDRRAPRRNATLPLPFGAGKTGSPRSTAKTKARARICLPGSRRSDGQPPVSGHRKSRSSIASSRNFGVGSGRAYSQSRSRLCQLGEDNCQTHRDAYQGRPNQNSVSPARYKKNGLNSGAAALRALNRCLGRLCHETTPASLFAQLPVVRFRPERDVCLCGHRLIVQKTRRKTVLSMTTPFIAHETVLECQKCWRVFFLKPCAG